MRRILAVLIVLLLALGMVSCGKPTEKQVEKMIEDAVEEALEDQAEDEDKDKDEKDEEDETTEEGKDEEDDDKDESNDGLASFSYDYMGEEIPEDFPSEAVPLYESGDATVVAAIKTTAGGTVSFTVGIGTNDETEDVIENVYDALKKMYKDDEIQKVSTGDAAMYIVSSDDWAFQISVGEGADEGFGTLIGYSVIAN